jgi:hypothetical protein
MARKTLEEIAKEKNKVFSFDLTYSSRFASLLHKAMSNDKIKYDDEGNIANKEEIVENIVTVLPEIRDICSPIPSKLNDILKNTVKVKEEIGKAIDIGITQAQAEMEFKTNPDIIMNEVKARPEIICKQIVKALLDTFKNWI